jgi:branched-chain amino acid transport system substrate-binding protein
MDASRRNILTGAVATALYQTAGNALTIGRAAAQPATGDKLPTIRIGVLTDLSGQYRDNSGPTSVAAAHQAVEDFGPKSHGFAVEILSADHQQKPDTASAVAREWFDRSDVDAIADMNNTAIAVAVTGVANQKDKALLVSGGASSDLTGRYCSPNLVHFTPDSWADSHACGNAILDQGGTSWFLVVANYRFGHTMAEEITSSRSAMARCSAASTMPSRERRIIRPIWSRRRRAAQKCSACAIPAATWKPASSRRANSA